MTFWRGFPSWLLAALTLAGCSEQKAEPGGSAAAPVSYDRGLLDLQGREVVARGYLLEATTKGYPKLFEKREGGRFILVTFPPGTDLEKHLRREIEVRGKVVVDLGITTSPDGRPQQGYDRPTPIISQAAIRDVP